MDTELATIESAMLTVVRDSVAAELDRLPDDATMAELTLAKERMRDALWPGSNLVGRVYAHLQAEM